MSQKLPVNSFKWKKDMSKFNEKFIRNYEADCDEGYILEVVLEYSKSLHDLHNDLPFLWMNESMNEWKLKDAKSLYVVCRIKL